MEPDLHNPLVQDALRDGTKDCYVVADGHRLPLANSCAAVVALFEVLEHVYAPEVFVRECARVLADGGLLLLTVPQYIHIHGWPYDYYRYTHYGLRYLMETAELEVVHVWPLGGPMMVLYRVIEMNFDLYNRPLRRLFLGNPLAVLFDFLDHLLFSDNLKRQHPDVAHWALMARKPKEIHQ